MDQEFLQKAYRYYVENLKAKGITEGISFETFSESFPYWYGLIVIHGDPNIPYMCNNGRTVILEHSSIIKKIKSS